MASGSRACCRSVIWIVQEVRISLLTCHLRKGKGYNGESPMIDGDHFVITITSKIFISLLVAILLNPRDCQLSMELELRDCLLMRTHIFCQ